VSFASPVKQSDVVTLEARVSRVFNSSMAIFIDVYVEDHLSRQRTQQNEAINTFVAVDKNGAPITVTELIPETELEKERYEGALRRRQLSLIIAGRMDPKEATELQKLFR